MVYVVRMMHVGHVKIGMSTNVTGRMNELQTSNPYKLKLLAKSQITSSRLALLLEDWAHRAFRPDRIRGEWFRNSAAVQRFIADLPKTPVAELIMEMIKTAEANDAAPDPNKYRRRRC